ncbi:MAG: FAD-dependent oxidoreductase [Clostridia bacterium]
MYDILIIGAGPAGLTAGIYASRAGKSVLILEQKTVGGQIISTPSIENYPAIKNISGLDFAKDLSEQAIALGSLIKNEKALKVIDEKDYKTVKTRRNEYQSKAVILATGAKNRPLGLENEELLIGSGVSYCATCDGAFFSGKDVAVVGGGSTALDDALFLCEYCKSVTLIHRRDAFRGEEHLVSILKTKKNINFKLNSVITKLHSDGLLSGITVKDILTEKEDILDISGLFIAIGQMPDNKAFSDIAKTDNYGYLIADESCKTETSGIFTAGDCRTKSIRQLTTATADGTISALLACEYINSL